MRVTAVAGLCIVLPVLISCSSNSAATSKDRLPSALSIHAGEGQTGEVGLPLPVAATVLVVDAQGRPTPGVTVTFIVMTGGGSVSSDTSLTDAEGVASVTWTLGSAAGVNALNAVVNPFDPVTFTATGVAGPPARVTKSAGDAQVDGAGHWVEIAPAVLIADRFGNGVANVPVAFTVTSGGGSVSESASVTQASGIASVGWVLGTVPGINTLEAAVAGLEPATFSATAVAVASSFTMHAGGNQAAPAGTAVAIPPSVDLAEPKVNPVANVTVTFIVLNGGGSVSADTSLTDAAGVATVSWTLGTAAGYNSLNAVLSPFGPVNFAATAIPGPPATVTQSAGDAQVAAPGGVVPIPPEVLVADRFGNPVANVPVDFAATAGGGFAACPSATNANGRASCGLWALGTARGENALSATVTGLTPAVFTATVRGDVVLDVGHSDGIQLLRTSGDRLLSWGFAGHWVLWEVATCSRIASGDSFCTYPCSSNSAVDLAGSTVLIGSPTRLETRDASDGHLLFRRVDNFAWTKLAQDGSYVLAATNTALLAWTRDGRPLFSRSGSYASAKAFAQGAAVRLAGGPAGSNVIETIDPSTGASSLGPAFNGAFHSWFTGSPRFITNLGNTVWVYSADSTPEAIMALPTIENLRGQGDWLWLWAARYPDYPLSLYRVDGGGVPAATYSLGNSRAPAPASDATIGSLFDDGRATIIDLAGGVPSRADFTLPIGSPSVLAASSSGPRFVGNSAGELLDGSTLGGALRHCGTGPMRSVAGGGDRIAVATPGRIRYLNARTSALEGEIAFSSSKVQLSSDGTVLAALGNDPQHATSVALKVFSLPTGQEVRSWPYEAGVFPSPRDFTLAASGTRIAQALATSSSSPCDHEMSALAGGPPIWTGMPFSCTVPLLLSPDGTWAAWQTPVNIFKEGVLMSAVPGPAVGWIDDGRLLVNKYVQGGRLPYHAGVEIRDPAGQLLATLPIPLLTSSQTITASSIYAPSRNAIYSLDAGAVLWSGPSGASGAAVAGSRVVYTFGSLLVSEAY